MRGATRWLTQMAKASNFNPRSPCGERLRYGYGCAGSADFNPRSPCGERPRFVATSQPVIRFQSTLPMRGATAVVVPAPFHVGISIHAPHAGSDAWYSSIMARIDHFNPRSPCGERLLLVALPAGGAEFQSTLPMRGATYCRFSGAKVNCNFNPRSPCGERRSFDCFQA